MLEVDARYLVQMLHLHGYKEETMPKAIVLLDTEHEDLVTRVPDASRGADDAIMIDGVAFVPLSKVKDRIPYPVYERANAGSPAMWWKPME